MEQPGQERVTLTKEGEKALAEHEAAGRGPAYPHNPIDGFSNGCLMDLRARLAVEFITHSPLMVKVAEAAMLAARPKGPGSTENSIEPAQVPACCARFAMDMASELLAESEARGWVKPLPEYVTLEDVLKGHAKRTGAFSFMQQVGGGEAQMAHQREQAANAPRVATAPAAGFPPAPGRKPS